MSKDALQGQAEPESSPKNTPAQVTQKDIYCRRLAQLSHDLRDPLAAICYAVEILPASSKAELKAKGAIKGSAKTIQERLKDAHDGELSPYTVADFHRMLQDILTKMPQSGRQMLEIEIGTFPSDIQEEEVPANPILWGRILENLISNAAKAHATRIAVSFEQTILKERGVPGLQIAIRDDGDGMTKEDAAKLQAGIRVSRRQEQGTLPAGDRPDEHGHGHQMIKRSIDDLSLGEREMNSQQRTPENPDHWCTIMLRIPLLNKKAVPPPAPTSKKFLTRRRALQLAIGGGIASIAGGISVLLKGESSEVPSQNPLQAIELDAQGNFSFTLEIDGKSVSYIQGQGHPDIHNISFVQHQGIGVLGCEIEIGPERHRQKMFLCSVPEGVLGLLHAVKNSKRQTGYVCIPRSPDGLLMQEDVWFPHTDVLYNGNVFSTKAELLTSQKLQGMAASLKRVAGIPQRETRSERQWMNVASIGVHNVISAHESCKRGIVSVSTLRQWQSLLAEQGKCIFLEPSAQQQLRQRSQSSQEIAQLRMRGNDLCFMQSNVANAQSIIRR